MNRKLIKYLFQETKKLLSGARRHPKQSQPADCGPVQAKFKSHMIKIEVGGREFCFSYLAASTLTSLLLSEEDLLLLKLTRMAVMLSQPVPSPLKLGARISLNICNKHERQRKFITGHRESYIPVLEWC
jgi:hypothetical protein